MQSLGKMSAGGMTGYESLVHIAKYVESADLLLYEKFFGSTGASGNSVSPFKIL